MRGRKPKPEAVKIAAGNPGKRKLKAAHQRPAAVTGGLDAPRHLGPVGRAEWRRIVPELARLGLVSRVSAKSLEAYCSLYDQLRACDQACKAGLTYVMPNGAIATRPEASLRLRILKELRAYAEAFGMTPATHGRATPLAAPDQPALPGAQAWPAQEDTSKPKAPSLPAELTDEHFFGPGSSTALN